MKYKLYSEKNFLVDLCYELFQFIFVFLTFNKEFIFGNFDLRYLGFFLSLILITFYFITHGWKFNIGKIEKKFYLFYFLVLFSNISWIWNGILINREGVLNLAILNIYNFLAFIVFSLYKEHIDSRKLNNLILASGLVMSISIFWLALGFSLPTFFTTGARTITVDRGLGEHYNLFGMSIRFAGFAEDPNYATLYAIIAIVISLFFCKKHLIRILLIIVFSLSASLSFSRTTFLGVIIAVVLTFMHKHFFQIKRLLYTVFVYGLISVSLLMPSLKFFSTMQTIKIRLNMWSVAKHLFLLSPFFGNGTGSFRCFFSSQHNGWHVQCHNTWWQVLSENGLFAAIILASIIINLLLEEKRTYQRFLLIVLTVLFISYEIVYLQIFILIFYVVQIQDTCETRGEKK